MKAGVAISPDTPSTSISDEVGELTDLLLVMTVYPGAGFFFLLPFLTLRTNTPRPRRPEVYGALRSQGHRAPRTVS
jgi:ribulose-phosphate 3-epimerase